MRHILPPVRSAVTEGGTKTAVTVSPPYRLTSEICGFRATDARGQRDPSVNAEWGCQLSGWRSDNNVAINSALATEGAGIAARIVREQRLLGNSLVPQIPELIGRAIIASKRRAAA